MGYIQALTAAGANVLAEGFFGSYQGNWYAKVEYQGEVILVGGAYGSCSYCDAFQSEFDYLSDEDGKYEDKLAAFGRQYLEDGLNVEVERSRAKEDSEWDMESRDMEEWLEEHFPTHGTLILEL